MFNWDWEGVILFYIGVLLYLGKEIDFGMRDFLEVVDSLMRLILSKACLLMSFYFDLYGDFFSCGLCMIYDLMKVFWLIFY